MARSGQRLGPGGSGPRAQPPAGPHLAQTRRSGTAYSPAARFNRLLVLSRKHLPRWSTGGGGRGRAAGLAQSPCWPQRQPPTLARPSIPPFVSQSLHCFWLGQASQVTFLSYRALFFCGSHHPPSIWSPPVFLPLPIGPLPHLLMPSSFDQEFLPGSTNHLPSRSTDRGTTQV